MSKATAAERSVVGGLFLDSSELKKVRPVLEPEDFSREEEGTVYRHMLKLSDEGLGIDPVTVCSSLSYSDELMGIGGLDLIFDLAGASANTSGIEGHARIVATASKQRQIAKLLSSAGEAFTGGEDATDLVNRLQEEVKALSTGGSSSTFLTASELFGAGIDAIQRAHAADGHITGLPTGINDLDEMTAGFQPADLIILAARPSMGKTALALQIIKGALDATRGDISAAFFSLEMPAVQMALRMIGSAAEVPSEGIRTGVLGSDEIHRLIACSHGLGKLQLHLDETAAIHLSDLRSRARTLHADPSTPPLGLIVIDYLQLMRGQGRSREQEISEISRGLKALAKELNVPVIALSQLNREVEKRSDKRPMMSDLRESGSIEQDADLVVFLYRDDYYNENSEDQGVCEVIIRKHRNGALGTVRLQFKKQTGVFK